MSPALAVLPDVEGAVRGWTRGLNLTNIGSRVFFEPPVRGATFPMVIATELPGARPLAGTAPVIRAPIQFDVLGQNPDGANSGGDRFTLRQIADALAAEVEALNPGTAMGPSAVGLSGEIDSGPFPRPNFDGRTRYILNVTFILRAA